MGLAGAHSAEEAPRSLCRRDCLRVADEAESRCCWPPMQTSSSPNRITTAFRLFSYGSRRLRLTNCRTDYRCVEMSGSPYARQRLRRTGWTRLVFQHVHHLSKLQPLPGLILTAHNIAEQGVLFEATSSETYTSARVRKTKGYRCRIRFHHLNARLGCSLRDESVRSISGRG